MTSFSVFKFMALYSLTEFIAVSILYAVSCLHPLISSQRLHEAYCSQLCLFVCDQVQKQNASLFKHDLHTIFLII